MANMDMNSTDLSFTPSTAQSFEITWEIPNVPSYSNSDYYKDYILQSPPFNFANAIWCLQIHLQSYGWCSFSLVRLKSLIPWHEFIFIISVNKKYYKETYRTIPFEKDCERFFCLTLRISDMQRNVLAEDCNVTLIYHLIYAKTKKEDSSAYRSIQNYLCVTQPDEKRRKAYSGEESEESDSSYEDTWFNGKKKFGTILLKSSVSQSIEIMCKIPNYFSLPDTPSYSITACPPFNFADATWCLKIYPNRTGPKVFREERFSLIRSHSLVPHQEIIYSTDVIKNEDPFYRVFYGKFSFNEDCELGAPYSYFPNRAEIYAPDGNVTLLFKFFCTESVEKDAVLQKMLCKLNSYKTFSQDMRNSLLDGQDYDLTLKVNDKEFRVHQNVLRARSEVFQSMLTHDMIEKNRGVVDILDCDSQIMEQFLLHMYCGKIDTLNETNMLGLYYTADKYMLTSLKEECHDFIQSSLSCSNICDIMQLALHHSDKSLLECATNFFVNHSSEILTTVEWKSFRNENKIAAEDLLSKTSKNAKNLS